jgi:hypothetical protein
MNKTEINIIKELKSRGFSTPFKVKEGMLVDLKSGQTYLPGEVSILKQYQYEGMSNPSDLSILFAIQTSDDKRGFILVPFGPKGDHNTIWFFNKVENKTTAKG